MAEAVTAFVDWPSAPLTKSLVERALKSLPHTIKIESALPKDLNSDSPTERLVQWSSYDSIDHELTARGLHTVISSSYIFRKALIRKHFLSRTINSYVTKHPYSPLARAVPRTWEIELTFADELDEMWTDELFDLAEFLEASDDMNPHWCILKPGMADRGMGIRLFNSKDGLQAVFEKFEENEDAEDEEEGDTGVVISQLRHFVVQVCPRVPHNPAYSHTFQEYLSNPLLLDPEQSAGKTVTNPRGHKASNMYPSRSCEDIDFMLYVQSSTFECIASLQVLLKSTNIPGYWLSSHLSPSPSQKLAAQIRHWHPT